MKIITDERCAQYWRAGHPERPARIRNTIDALRSQTDLPMTWAEPAEVKDASILRAHSPELLASLDEGNDFDSDTPCHPDIVAHARRSVGGALEALESAREGTKSFSLLRPPGHHATRNQAMGFCYLNSIAIAALEALSTGAKRVAVYDFDVHHGNGTEAILKDVPGSAFFSIHQYPCYPGTGGRNVGKNCFNFPVSPGTPRSEYRRILSKALEELKGFEPDMVAVSAGFDAYARDPLADGTLEVDDYFWLGEELSKLGIPLFSILEGGYSDDLPQLILAYLKGLKS